MDGHDETTILQGRIWFIIQLKQQLKNGWPSCSRFSICIYGCISFETKTNAAPKQKQKTRLQDLSNVQNLVDIPLNLGWLMTGSLYWLMK